MYSNSSCLPVSSCFSGATFIKRLTAEKEMAPDDSVSRLDHETVREKLEGEVSHLTQLLQGALRKQDELALDAADAWQKVRRKRRGSTNPRKYCTFLNNLCSSIRRGTIAQSVKPCRSW